MVPDEIDLSSEETENGDEVQTSVLQIPNLNQFKDLRALKLKVPCVTWEMAKGFYLSVMMSLLTQKCVTDKSFEL